MNLIPTPRTDKNGNTVIRHMKPEVNSAPVRKSLPPVSPVLQQTSAPSAATGLDNKEIIKLISYLPVIGEELDVDENLLNQMRDCGEDEFARATSYLSTGSRNARELSQRAFAFCVSDFKQATVSGDVVNDERAGQCVGKYLESQVVRSWATGNTADEIGYTGNLSALKGSVAYFNSTVLEAGQNKISPEYWRGVVALTLADPDEKAQRGHSEQFIAWVSEREDFALAIKTAKERGTVIPEALEAILDQDLAAPLKQGAL